MNMLNLLIGLSFGGILLVGGAQSNKQGTAVTGEEALAIRVAVASFEKNAGGTPLQRDLSHYTLTVSMDKSNIYVSFDPNAKPRPGVIDWSAPEGFYVKVVIDRKTRRYLRTVVLA